MSLFLYQEKTRARVVANVRGRQFANVSLTEMDSATVVLYRAGKHISIQEEDMTVEEICKIFQVSHQLWLACANVSLNISTGMSPNGVR